MGPVSYTHLLDELRLTVEATSQGQVMEYRLDDGDYSSQAVSYTHLMAARACGISRSAFYKYKDSVELFDRGGGSMITLYFSLADEPGVLSAVLGCIYDAGANILTINQNLPADGVAPVTIALKLGEQTTAAQLQISLLGIPGVVRVREI